MPKYDQDTAVLMDTATGLEIVPGTEVIGFRDETYRFEYVSKLPGGNSGGKIIASQPCKHDEERGHFSWCADGWSQRELFPSVLNGRILMVGEHR